MGMNKWLINAGVICYAKLMNEWMDGWMKACKALLKRWERMSAWGLGNTDGGRDEEMGEEKRKSFVSITSPLFSCCQVLTAGTGIFIALNGDCLAVLSCVSWCMCMSVVCGCVCVCLKIVWLCCHVCLGVYVCICLLQFLCLDGECFCLWVYLSVCSVTFIDVCVCVLSS